MESLPIIRQRIIRIAIGELGKVSDRPGKTTKGDGPYGQVRFGWQNLKLYLDEALETPLNWSVTFKSKYTDIAQNTHSINPLEGIKYMNMRVPTHGQLKNGNWNGIHWCGIFATWVLRRASFKVKWRLGGGTKDGIFPTHSDIRRPQGGIVRRDWGAAQKDIRPGDVCMIGAASHHFIVEKIQGNILHVIAGNSLYQEIAREKYPIGKIVRTYSTWPE